MLLVLVLLIGVGAYNYHRNLKLEIATEGPRPFKSYQTADLESLKSAYQQELDAYQRQYQKVRNGRTGVEPSGQLLDEKLANFERARKTGNAMRAATSEVADREARMREINRELNVRASLANGFALHMKRLVSI